MGQLYANIIVDISQEKLDRTFSYLVPETMQNLIHVGDVVQVPFGKGNRLTKGYVVELTGTTQYQISKVKPVQVCCSRSYHGGTGNFKNRICAGLSQSIAPEASGSI